MPKISGPAVYSCTWCGRSVEQGESCWCKQSQEKAMTRQEIRAALKGARADNVRLTADRDRLRKALVFARDFIMSEPRPGDEMAVQRISAALESRRR